MGLARPADCSDSGAARRVLSARGTGRAAVVSLFLCLCASMTSCTVEGDECDRDGDCPRGFYCQNAGGVLVRGAVCVPDGQRSDGGRDVPAEGRDTADGDPRDSRSTDTNDTIGEESGPDSSFEPDVDQCPRCSGLDCECSSKNCCRQCRPDDRCTLRCPPETDCSLYCPEQSDCEFSDCTSATCNLDCARSADCRIDDCTGSDCTLRCRGPDCEISTCTQTDSCLLICLGGTCTIEECVGTTTCRLRCADENGNCDLRCEGSGCVCEGPDGCGEP